MQHDSGIMIGKQFSGQSVKSMELSSSKKEFKVSSFTPDLLPLKEEAAPPVRGNSDTSTDDREETQQFITKSVDDMMARIRMTHKPVQSKIAKYKPYETERYRDRKFSLIPEGDE